MTREDICTTEIAKRFGKAHRNILIEVRRLIEQGDDVIGESITESSYISPQNKSLPCYKLGLAGFCLLTDTWGYSRGDSAIVKAEILREFGEDFAVVGSRRTRSEDCFYDTLKRFLSKDRIVRQMPIGKYKADFYLIDYGIIVEYDEEQHFSKSAREADAEREKGIHDFFAEKFDDTVSIIRVKIGSEIEGLAKIAGAIALATVNATGITKYAE